MDSILTAQSFLLTTYSSLLILLLLLHFSQTSLAINPPCTPSACGIIRNISYPFRFKNDPHFCGDPKFELECEDNVPSIYFDSHKYYVKAINYGFIDGFLSNSTIRLVDASIKNDDICSFPTSSAYYYNFSHLNHYNYPFEIPNYDDDIHPINFISCPFPLSNSSVFTDVTNCSAFNSLNPSRSYAYIKLGGLNASELPHMCNFDVIVMTNWKFKDFNNASLSEIHDSLLYGFELQICSWCIRSSFSSTWRDLFLPLLVIIVGELFTYAPQNIFQTHVIGSASFLGPT